MALLSAVCFTHSLEYCDICMMDMTLPNQLGRERKELGRDLTKDEYATQEATYMVNMNINQGTVTLGANKRVFVKGDVAKIYMVGNGSQWDGSPRSGYPPYVQQKRPEDWIAKARRGKSQKASHQKDDGLEMDHALADDCLDDPLYPFNSWNGKNTFFAKNSNDFADRRYEYCSKFKNGRVI